MKYTLGAYLTISTYTEVEADSLEEAIEIASGRDVCEIHTDGIYTKEELWMVDELDGVPQNIKLEDVK